MLAKLNSIAITGINAEPVEIEVDLARGLPGIIMVGLPDKSVQESRDRVKSAIINSGYDFPNRKIVVNLAPAELKKEGGVYDLPIALAILEVTEQLNAASASPYLIIGELALDGSVRPVRGALAAAITARQSGYKGLIMPADNLREAMVVSEQEGKAFKTIGVKNLEEALGFLNSRIEPPLPPVPEIDEEIKDNEPDFIDVRGHESLKRAILVAAAGHHNLILMGPPGSGKTMAAKRIPGILPELSYAESLETTKIFSIAGELKPGSGLVRSRPFRNPHHSISSPGLVGGGSNPRPGEISLAHHGVLFLDEAPEFSRSILETLRQPLEDGSVTISRASGSVCYPANLMLVLSQNLCPCGRRGDPAKRCDCTPKQISGYVDKLSGPLLDRIDIQMEVPALSYDLLRNGPEGRSSAEMRSEVIAAREVQSTRYEGRVSPVNALMDEKDIKEYCRLSHACEEVMRMAMQELGFSARAHSRILKVARTIADLAGSDEIDELHLTEAIQYRRLDISMAY